MADAPNPAPTHQCYRAVFISPHLDDAVFSCGGRIAQLREDGPVLVLNLFTRYLADLKIHGAVMGEQRHQEERDAAAFLGFESRSLDELDAPFRREAYRQLGNLFRPPCQPDLNWLPSLRAKLFGLLSKWDFDELYVPLGIGWHVDHVLTHQLFDTWEHRAQLLYYEDAPYCQIPHATRYRLDELASYPREAADQSLAPAPALRAWWQAASAYANTALMRNLQPWFVRQAAVPAVGYYLWRLMAQHRANRQLVNQRTLKPWVANISEQFERKLDAMTLYKSQFGEFFSSKQDGKSRLLAYCSGFSGELQPLERYYLSSNQTSVVKGSD